MTAAAIDNAKGFGAYVEDITHFASKFYSAAAVGVGFLGDRCVIWLQGASLVLKSPASLRFTVRGVVALVNAIEQLISAQISNMVIKIATAIQTGVAAWKVGTTIQYFWNGVYDDDYKLTKICSIASECFLFVARVVVTAAWLVEQNVLSLALCANIVGSIPVIGVTLYTMGSQAFINSFFLAGLLFLFVDRVRAAINGGYVNEADEEAKVILLREKMEKEAHDNIEGPFSKNQVTEFERQITLYLEEKKRILHWVAWADVVNLIAESALLIMSFSPLTFNLLGLVACSAGVTSCLWDLEPENRPVVAF